MDNQEESFDKLIEKMDNQVNENLKELEKPLPSHGLYKLTKEQFKALN